ncbi:MAG: flippase activity-associated protein Agl23 [Opitutales bacterium]
MFKHPFIWLAWIGIAVLALWLRTQNLCERPIHADEATGARITALRLENAHYQFNPKHFHGPWLSLSGALIATAKGEHSWSELSLSTLRSGTVLAGLLLTLTPLLWRRALGDPATLAAGGLLATSPLLVYYSQMYIHEIWLALFGMLALPMLYRFVVDPSIRNGILTGVFIGLMFATKETVAISVLGWSVAGGASLLALRYCKSGCQTGTAQTRSLSSYRNGFGVMATTALALGAVFYTNCFQQPMAIVDAFETYFVYQTTSGHEKAWTYYFELLLWPKHSLGVWWTEGLVLFVTIAALVLACRDPKRLPATSLIALGCAAHWLIYTCISYKTPWLMLLPWALSCLLAGLAFSTGKHSRPFIKVLSLILLIMVAGFQTKQSLYATGRYAADERNPYSYAPTTKDPARIIEWIQQLDALSGSPVFQPTAVVGTGYWPLPWYLREFREVGYWPAPEAALQEFPLVFGMPEQKAACNEMLQSSHTAFPRSLRSNVAVTLYLRNDIWEEWIAEPE